MPRRPPRLPSGCYLGMQAYSLTAITHHRVPVFRCSPVAREVIAQLLHCAARNEFAVPAYCLMPDHAHVLLRGRTPACDFLSCVGRWRERTGRAWKRWNGTRLWQEGYWDRTLRSEDDERRCAAHIVNNPVRAGLVTTVADYPFLGSTEYTMEELAGAPLDAQIAAGALFRSRR